MENFAKILMYLEITGVVLGFLGTLFSIVVYHLDVTWQRYMPENEIASTSFPRSRHFYRLIDRQTATTIINIEHQNGNEYHYLRNIYQIQARSTKCDGIACVMMGILLFVAMAHISCSVLNKSCRERMQRHKSFNKIVAFCSILSALFLLYTLVYSNRAYDSYIENTFYQDDQSQINSEFEPEVHWPCCLLKTNDSKPNDDDGTVGPHMCQYKLYKIVSVVLFLCYSTIAISIMHLIRREELNRLVGAVEEEIGPMRRRLQSCIRRRQVAAEDALQPVQPRRLQDSNATLISGNINVYPSGFSSSPTLNGSDCIPISNIQNANDHSAPPPYTANNQRVHDDGAILTSTTLPTNVQIVHTSGNPIRHVSVIVPIHQRNSTEEPPPSYSSTIMAVNGWSKP